MKTPDLSKFWHIVVISNPVRYHSRYDLFNKIAYQYENKNCIFVEIAFGDRPFEVTERDNPKHLQFRSFDEIWHKEAMINRGIEYLSQIAPDWEKVSWIDGDVIFSRPDWDVETWHELEHFMFVQMFQTAVDLGPDGQAIKCHNGFVFNYKRGVYEIPPGGSGKDDYYYFHKHGLIGHSGFCWAARREAIDAVGGLIDWAILGSGDMNMAMGLIGRIEHSYPSSVTPSYDVFMKNWQRKADRYIMRDVGFVKGNILHLWHGKKKDRRYKDRWQILVKNRFSPIADLKQDSQGLPQLHMDGSLRMIELRDDIRDYFRSRNEDSIDLA